MIYPRSVLLEMALKQPIAKSLFTTTLQQPWPGSLVKAEPLEKSLRIYEGNITGGITTFKSLDKEIAADLQRRRVGGALVRAALPLDILQSGPVAFDKVVLPIFYEMNTFDMFHVQNIAEMAWKSVYSDKPSDGEQVLFSIIYSKLPEYAAAKILFGKYASQTSNPPVELASNLRKEMLRFFVESIEKAIETFNSIMKDIGPKGYPF